jgi:hypothetical protein
MNEDFLTNFRKTPRREFAAALYKRINIPMKTQSTILLRRVTFSAAIGLALIAALAFSPAAQAALSYLMREIGGITYIQPDEASSEATPVPGQETTIREESMSLAEAQEVLPFAFSLPTWVPDGFVMGPSVTVSYFSENYTPARISWWGPDMAAGPIVLIVGPRVNWQVDLDHVQEVQVNGQPAGLTGGGWDADSGQWDSVHHNLTLTWMRGDIMYQLLSPAITAEEIIRVAESIP